MAFELSGTKCPTWKKVGPREEQWVELRELGRREGGLGVGWGRGGADAGEGEGEGHMVGVGEGRGGGWDGVWGVGGVYRQKLIY